MQAFVSSNVQALVGYWKMNIIENTFECRIPMGSHCKNRSKGEAGKTRSLIDMFRSKISNSGKTVGDTMKLERKAVE